MQTITSNEYMTDKEAVERMRMALEAILCLENYHNIALAKKIAQKALQEG